MLCEGELLSGASLTYGVIICLTSFICWLISLGYTIYFYVMKCKDRSYILYTAVGLGIFFLFGVLTKYSSKLVVGILTNQPKEIKKYLTFAVIPIILSFSTTIMIIIAIPLQGYDIALALAPNLIFALLNYMVYMTYKTMKEELKSQGEGAAGDVENNGGVANKQEILSPAPVPACQTYRTL